ncbi:MAG: DUF5712 family protein [Candidatus Amoebophilus sp.]
MYVSVGKGEKMANTGSCGALVSYLEKENKETAKRIYFFDQHREDIQPGEVIQTIDSNIRKLGKTDAKYFMVTVSPSSKELEHIENSSAKLMSYARAVMEEYARAFNRGITGEDLVYFGKIEQGRTFTGADSAVKLGIVRAGSPKPGLHTHVHIIVSRKDKTQRLKLSPETNHKTNRGNFQGGFNKVQFFLACEKAFDEQFAYLRPQVEAFAYWRQGQQAQRAQSLHHKTTEQVRSAIGQALQDTPTLLAWTQTLTRQGIRPIFEKDKRGQVTSICYQLESSPLACQQGGRIILTRDENEKPALGCKLERQVQDKIAQRPISFTEKEQLLKEGYSDYLTGFVSRLGKPFAARLYFDAQNKLKFSFNYQVPEIATPNPWTRQELKEFVFPRFYRGIPLTEATRKQLIASQVTKFLPQLITRLQPATNSSFLITEKDLGAGFEFASICQKLGQVIQSQDIEQVEKWLAQGKSQESFKPGQTVNSPPSPTIQQELKPSLASFFLPKAWYKLGFSQPQEESSDNRLARLKKRRRKRKFLNLN